MRVLIPWMDVRITTSWTFLILRDLVTVTSLDTQKDFDVWVPSIVDNLIMLCWSHGKIRTLEGWRRRNALTDGKSESSSFQLNVHRNANNQVSVRVWLLDFQGKTEEEFGEQVLQTLRNIVVIKAQPCWLILSEHCASPGFDPLCSRKAATEPLVFILLDRSKPHSEALAVNAVTCANWGLPDDGRTPVRSAVAACGMVSGVKGHTPAQHVQAMCRIVQHQFSTQWIMGTVWKGKLEAGLWIWTARRWSIQCWV